MCLLIPFRTPVKGIVTADFVPGRIHAFRNSLVDFREHLDCEGALRLIDSKSLRTFPVSYL